MYFQITYDTNYEKRPVTIALNPRISCVVIKHVLPALKAKASIAPETIQALTNNKKV